MIANLKKSYFLFTTFVFHILITNLIRIMNGLNKHISLVTIHYDTMNSNFIKNVMHKKAFMYNAL